MIALVILIALPLIEIAVLIKVGQWIGFWPTLGLILATFVLGAAVLGRSGFTSAIKVREALGRGEPPVAAMIDSAMIVVAGVLLITPGLIADAVGIGLLIPPARHQLVRLVLRNAMVFGDFRTGVGSGRRRPTDGSNPGSPRPSSDGQGGPLIEGEFERLDERPVKPHKPTDDGAGG
jgi:UPF0716 protein FxsA